MTGFGWVTIRVVPISQFESMETRKIIRHDSNESSESPDFPGSGRGGGQIDPQLFKSLITRKILQETQCKTPLKIEHLFSSL